MASRKQIAVGIVISSFFVPLTDARGAGDMEKTQGTVVGQLKQFGAAKFKGSSQEWSEPAGSIPARMWSETTCEGRHELSDVKFEGNNLSFCSTLSWVKSYRPSDKSAEASSFEQKVCAKVDFSKLTQAVQVKQIRKPGCAYTEGGGFLGGLSTGDRHTGGTFFAEIVLHCSESANDCMEVKKQKKYIPKRPDFSKFADPNVSSVGIIVTDEEKGYKLYESLREAIALAGGEKTAF